MSLTSSRSRISGSRGNQAANVAPFAKKTAAIASAVVRGECLVWRTMSAVTIYHNPNCGSSKNAVRIADELGAQVEVVQYLKQPLDESALRDVLAKLEDPHTDLVRRDSHWTKLGLTDADAATDDQIVELLVEHPRLMQRPLLVTPDRALIGRPKERVTEILGG